jgi:hypothetical protein
MNLVLAFGEENDLHAPSARIVAEVRNESPTPDR